MPGGGDECIRNSLVCKIVSMHSKYSGAVTCDVTPVFWVAPGFAGWIRAGGFRGHRTLPRAQWPPIFGAWCKAWFEVTDESGSLEVALESQRMLCFATWKPPQMILPNCLAPLRKSFLRRVWVRPRLPSWGEKGSSAHGVRPPAWRPCLPNSCSGQARPCF